MPLKASSFAITNAYRREVATVRKAAQREARQTWAKLDTADLSGTYDAGPLALHVITLQRQAARLSGAYLRAYLENELGHKVEVPPTNALTVGRARSGKPMREAVMSPLIGVKVDIGRGAELGAAMRKGEHALERMVGLATDNTAREALRHAIADADEITGWQRAVKGTCEACVGAADGPRDGSEYMDTHPNCECVQEPLARAPTVAASMLDRVPPVSGEGGRAAYEEYDALGYTQSQTRALNDYLGSVFSFRVNAVLRGLAEDTGATTRMTENLDGALKHAGPIGERVEVRRVLGGKPSDYGLPDDVKDLKGAAFTEKGFSSTSSLEKSLLPGRRYEEPEVTMNVTVDPRVRGIYGANPEEAELLLERDTRYVITNAEHERKAVPHADEPHVPVPEKDYYRLDVTILPPEGR